MSDNDWAKWRTTVPSHVLVQKVNDQAALLHLDSEIYFGLDSVGIAMWEALEENGTVGAAHEALTSMFVVDGGVLARDLVALIEKLEQNDLLQVAR